MQSERPDLNLGSNLFYTQGADVPHGVLSYPAGRLTDLSNPAILDFLRHSFEDHAYVSPRPTH
jgi:hypothetical protein